MTTYAVPPVPADSRAAADANAAAWEEVLDRLERDVEATEELVRSVDTVLVAPEPAPWVPPMLNGPLPDHLLGRARSIHQRQGAARAALNEAMAANRARLARAQGRPVAAGAPASPAPAYVDVSA